MRQRGRKSANSVAVIDGALSTPPEPPDDISREEAAIWRAVVTSEPANFFGTEATRQLLKSYVRHTAAADAISGVMGAFKTEWLKTGTGVERFDHLSRLRDREARSAMMTAVRLRLTNSARYTPGRAATAANNHYVGDRPWET